MVFQTVWTIVNPSHAARHSIIDALLFAVHSPCVLNFELLLVGSGDGNSLAW
jgi:hypothetical protein